MPLIKRTFRFLPYLAFFTKGYLKFLYNGWNLPLERDNGWNLPLERDNFWNLPLECDNGWNLPLEHDNG